ncbi:MAG TPA: NAD(P)H-dependent oxidoreductase [Bacteroidota bacterium]|nr:NAD(P)H-dependent oxidoreductase [Bacteroidota bacterium]
MDLLERLNWRYATKRMTGEKLPKEKVERILEAIRLAPSSIGLQPYTIYVVEDAALREKIKTAANQPQITESSHLLVFAAWNHYTPAEVDAYIQNIAATRKVDVKSLDGFKTSITKSAQKSPEALLNWNARQAYIALGFGLTAAALEGVDATPMEGFDADGLDEVLGLKAKGEHSVVLMALGKRDAANDYLVNAKKVRRPKEQLFVHLR